MILKEGLAGLFLSGHSFISVFLVLEADESVSILGGCDQLALLVDCLGALDGHRDLC